MPPRKKQLVAKKSMDGVHFIAHDINSGLFLFFFELSQCWLNFLTLENSSLILVLLPCFNKDPLNNFSSCGITISITGVKVRVYCQVGKADQGKFALHVAVKTLELYKEYSFLFIELI